MLGEGDGTAAGTEEVAEEAEATQGAGGDEEGLATAGNASKAESGALRGGRE